jgi:hypothetical protein
MPCEVTPPGEGAAASWPPLSPAMEQQRHASRSNLPPQFRSTTGRAARAAISCWNSVGRTAQLSLERTSKSRQHTDTAIPRARGRSAGIPPNGVDPRLFKRRKMKFSETSPVELGRWHSFRPSLLLPSLPERSSEQTGAWKKRPVLEDAVQVHATNLSALLQNRKKITEPSAPGTALIYREEVSHSALPCLTHAPLRLCLASDETATTGAAGAGATPHSIR